MRITRALTQVARELKVKPDTVDKYVQRCKRKLGTRSLRTAIEEATRYYVVLSLAAMLMSIGICEVLGLCP